MIKGLAGPPADDPYRVDGLAGATMTSRGVTNMLRFWLARAGLRARTWRRSARGGTADGEDARRGAHASSDGRCVNSAEGQEMADKTSSSRQAPDLVQVKNPRSGRYVKIDKSVGRIVSHKKSPRARTRGVRVVRAASKRS